MKLNAVHRLTAIPALIESQDFGLSNEAKNRWTLKNLLKSERLEDLKLGSTVLKKAEDEGLTFLFLSHAGLLTFYVQIEDVNFPSIGVGVVQTALWRSLHNSPDGITSSVFKYLLRTNKAVVSDSHHTSEGRRFWIRRLSLAFAEGRRIGFLNGGKFTEIEEEGLLKDFTSADSFMHAWGAGPSYENIRFVIFKQKRLIK